MDVLNLHFLLMGIHHVLKGVICMLKVCIADEQQYVCTSCTSGGDACTKIFPEDVPNAVGGAGVYLGNNLTCGL